MKQTEKIKLFHKMAKELADYNENMGRGRMMKAPVYDPELFIEFRGWQAQNILDDAQKHGQLLNHKVIYGKRNHKRT